MASSLNINVDSEKGKIISFLSKTGPIVSNSIGNALHLQSFVVNALLSELLNAKSIKASFLRVGSSPLYYLQEHEDQLEKFSNYLNHKEKEAYNLLKKEAVLKDSELEPAIRVALRFIQDFAVPFKIVRGTEEISFWKYKFSNEVDDKLKILMGEKKAKVKEKLEETKPSIIAQEQVNKEETEEPVVEKLKPKRKAREKKSSNDLLSKWAEKNDISIKEILFSKGNEIKAKVMVKSNLGEIDFLLVLKDKKTISESDLSLAYQEGINLKMPAIFLTSGSLNKASQTYLDSLGKNLILRKL